MLQQLLITLHKSDIVATKKHVHETNNNYYVATGNYIYIFTKHIRRHCN